MITIPTTLIIGAGGSKSYDYPIGSELKDQIIATSLDAESVNFYSSLSIEPFLLDQFIKSLEKTPLTSVDSFLEHNPKFTEIGKLAIVRELIKYEQELILYKKKNWYQYLFLKLSGSSFEDFGKNIKIITFNYDRSLEHFLFISLKNTYTSKSEDECAAKIASLSIKHVHGKMGNLPWEKQAYFREYAPSSDPTKIRKVSEGIRIVHEENLDEDESFKQAQKFLLDSERIYFLGFGYYQVNLKRLGLLGFNKADRVIKGTALGLSTTERNDISKLTNELIELVANHYDNITFLRENAELN